MKNLDTEPSSEISHGSWTNNRKKTTFTGPIINDKNDDCYDTREKILNHFEKYFIDFFFNFVTIIHIFGEDQPQIKTINQLESRVEQYYEQLGDYRPCLKGNYDMNSFYRTLNFFTKISCEDRIYRFDLSPKPVFIYIGKYSKKDYPQITRFLKNGGETLEYLKQKIDNFIENVEDKEFLIQILKINDNVFMKNLIKYDYETLSEFLDEDDDLCY